MDEAEAAYPVTEYAIRYEGADAAEHQIDLHQLGISLQGFARVLAVCAHIANTGTYNKQFNALSVKVYASPVQEHHCYEVMATIKEIAASKEMWSGFGGVVLTLLVQYVFSRRSNEEMKHLSAALQQSLGQQAQVTDRLLATVEKMADALRPAARQALAPVGTSVNSIGIYRAGEAVPAVVVDQTTKDYLATAGASKIEATREYVGIISEMDMATGTCRVTLDGDDQATRLAAVITDPVGRTAGNPYAMAMALQQPLAFMAKAEVDAEGDLVRLHIIDIAPKRTS